VNTTRFLCPRCRGGLEKVSDEELRCAADELVFGCRDGIWRFLLPERESHYARFISDYETVRRFEGRFSADSSYYRALPFQDLSGKFSADWKIRAVSYRALEKIITSNKNVSHIVDLGAGNGWLSNRLALQGYQVSAVDLLINSEDGLGACRHYKNQFTRVQSEFTRMPFFDASVSTVIFNASFHYSENYEETLAEALRVLYPTGQVIIMDSPVYHDPESGEQMLAERKTDFISRYGFASDSIKSEGYLTYQRMNELARKFGLTWHHIRPFYGTRWTLRPWLARMRGRREPAEFGLWVASR
jgi:ubiquinone/menaquinone biosynthesis C-methylase UbiE